MTRFTDSVYEFDNFRVDPKTRVLRLGREPVPLTPKAFEMLLVLVRSQGRLMLKDELIKAVWPDSFVEDSNLTQIVFVLRKVLEETPDRRYILTVQGQGYRFVADVKEIPGSIPTGTELSVAASGQALASHPRQGTSNAVPLDHSLVRQRWLYLGGALGILAVALSIAYLGWLYFRTQSQPPRDRVMLAVLPFQNLTGDREQDYFSDGMTEEMIAQLGNLDPQHVGVIGRTSVMRYKNSQPSLNQVGRELGVQYVLEGSVRRDSGKVRITARLVQIKDQTNLWARKYDRDLSNLLVLQGEIAQEICDEIQLTLGDHKKITPSSKPSLSPQAYEAYDLYLKGRYFWNQRSLEGFHRAIDYFQQSISKDPNYARAYAGLADSYTLLNSYGGAPPIESMPKARTAALKALELDESLAEAHTSLALITENYDWDWPTAEKEYRRAIELDPNYATAHHWYAEYLTWLGRFDEAFNESEKARQLDPLSPIIAVDNGQIFYYSRQYDRAIAKFRSVIEMHPDFRRGLLISSYEQKGMYAEALADSEQWRRSFGESAYNLAELAYIYGRTGEHVQARHTLAKLEELNRRQTIDTAILSRAYLGIGDNNQALFWLEKASAQHSNLMTTLKVDPRYDPLRNDPRFQDLVRHVGLAE